MEFRYAMCRAPWPGRPAATYHRKVDRIRDADLAELGIRVFGDMEDVDVVRDALHTAVDEVLMADRPDTARLVVRDREFILTGGLANGDSDPTEAFGAVQMLWLSGITLVRRPDLGHAARRALDAEVAGALPDVAAEGVALLQRWIAVEQELDAEADAEDDLPDAVYELVDGEVVVPQIRIAPQIRI